MADAQVLTDETFDAALAANRAVLLLLQADDLRGDANAEFKKAVDAHADIAFAHVRLDENPAVAERFSAGSKSVLIALFDGEAVVRRKRPWGSDVPLAIEMLQATLAEAAVENDAVENDALTETDSQSETRVIDPKENSIMDTTPVNVTDQDFQQEVVDFDLPVLVDFWAEWCGPCRMVAPILDKLAGEYAGKVRIAKVNVDENPGLSQYFQVMSIPTMMMFKDRTVVFNQAGALPEPALRDLLDQLVNLELPPEEERQTMGSEESN